VIICDRCKKGDARQYVISQNECCLINEDLCKECFENLWTALKYARTHVHEILKKQKKHLAKHPISYDDDDDGCYTNTERVMDTRIDCCIMQGEPAI
jgi:hypothetical protein